MANRNITNLRAIPEELVRQDGTTYRIAIPYVKDGKDGHILFDVPWTAATKVNQFGEDRPVPGTYGYFDVDLDKAEGTFKVTDVPANGPIEFHEMSKDQIGKLWDNAREENILERDPHIYLTGIPARMVNDSTTKHPNGSGEVVHIKSISLPDPTSSPLPIRDADGEPTGKYRETPFGILRVPAARVTPNADDPSKYDVYLGRANVPVRNYFIFMDEYDSNGKAVFERPGSTAAEIQMHFAEYMAERITKETEKAHPSPIPGPDGKPDPSMNVFLRIVDEDNIAYDDTTATAVIKIDGHEIRVGQNQIIESRNSENLPLDYRKDVAMPLGSTAVLDGETVPAEDARELFEQTRARRLTAVGERFGYGETVYLHDVPAEAIYVHADEKDPSKQVAEVTAFDDESQQGCVLVLPAENVLDENGGEIRTTNIVKIGGAREPIKGYHVTRPEPDPSTDGYVLTTTEVFRIGIDIGTPHDIPTPEKEMTPDLGREPDDRGHDGKSGGKPDTRQPQPGPDRPGRRPEPGQGPDVNPGPGPGVPPKPGTRQPIPQPGPQPTPQPGPDGPDRNPSPEPAPDKSPDPGPEKTPQPGKPEPGKPDADPEPDKPEKPEPKPVRKPGKRPGWDAPPKPIHVPRPGKQPDKNPNPAPGKGPGKQTPDKQPDKKPDKAPDKPAPGTAPEKKPARAPGRRVPDWFPTTDPGPKKPNRDMEPEM